MNLLVLLVGITASSVFGWLLLRFLEGDSPVLGTIERMLWSMTLGPTAHMLLVFTIHITTHAPLTRLTFLLPLLCGIAGLLAYDWHRGWLRDALPHWRSLRALLPLRRHGIVMILLVWTALKIGAGMYDAWIMPTVWDDSFNNWNMRAKVFVEKQKIVLEMPGGNERVIGAEGVNSYPPSLPLLKTWLTVLRGRWQEPLTNGIHPLWLLATLGALGAALLRRRGIVAAAIGIYALASLPLFFLHGINPYADAFVASHLLLAVLSIVGLQESLPRSPDERTWKNLLGLAIGLLIFTKNEGVILYVPLLLVTLGWVLIRRGGIASLWQMLTAACITLFCAMPWLAFKWSHGLTFGNAKAVADTAFACSLDAAGAMVFQWTQEPNFLLLPLFLVLTLVFAHRTVRREAGVLFGFLFLAILAQFSMFSCVQQLTMEAIKQTGAARGQVHLAPIAIMAVIMVWTKRYAGEVTHEKGHS